MNLPFKKVATTGRLCLCCFGLIFLAVGLSFHLSQAQSVALEPCARVLEIRGTIGPGTLDYWQRGLVDNKCGSILLEIDTPGGNLQTTRMLVEAILASPVPVLCLVTPAGAHAGSAGAILMQACHVSGMITGTNMGAATPIAVGGQMSEDLRKKILEDTKSLVRSLATLRGRNAEFASETVVNARAVSAEEALQLKAIDTVVGNREVFLAFADERVVELSNGQKVQVSVRTTESFKPDSRFRFIDFITDPELAYLIFMASLALLYFELTHPGTIAPGVAGALGLVISAIAFHKLEVSGGGLVLIILGLLLLFAEAFVPSFGALGVGGIIALSVGSVFLFDPQKFGVSLSLMVALSTAIGIGSALLGLAILAYRTRKTPPRSLTEAMIGAQGVIKSFALASRRQGLMYVRGEYWKFSSSQDLAEGDQVEVISSNGLTLNVRKQE